jgi:DNA-binding NarL/FixJ family response regulator/tetratricopeptide (TPR) repeat protein
VVVVDDLRTVGRQAHQERAWRQAAETLRVADSVEGLDPENLAMLAEAAFLSGDVTGCVQAYERAFAGHAARGASRAAARSAIGIGRALAMKGAQAAAGGWLGRAARILDDSGEFDCAERGLLLMPVARAHFAAGRYAEALEVARTAEEIGRRHGEADLVAFAQHSQGRSLLRLERLDEALAMLDQVFVEVFPAGLQAGTLTGLVACSVVDGCQQVGAFDRAAEWTAALSAWCDEQPELVQFSAECRVHRAEVLLRRGYWHGSLVEARAAARCAERDGVAAMAAASAYGRGEALRMLGRTEDAERAYLDAQQRGHDPMPGLARLRLQQHRGPAALSALRRALAMTDDPLHRAHLLPAAVDVLLAADASTEAADAAAELAELAQRWPTAGLRAAALHAAGAVALTEGSAAAAAAALRDAWDCWTSQQAPYEAAQARLLLAQACEALGDDEAAAAHGDAATHAVAALHRAGPPAPDPDAARTFGLSSRERQVLGLVAAGLTNRAIAERLVLSERTIDRHVSNILGKLGVPTRTAATAFAFEHDLTGH